MPHQPNVEMTTDLTTSVARHQRLALYSLLIEPMAFVAKRCAAAWPERQRLDAVLADAMRCAGDHRIF